MSSPPSLRRSPPSPSFFEPKCNYPKCILLKCTRLVCLLSFVSSLSSNTVEVEALRVLFEQRIPLNICSRALLMFRLDAHWHFQNYLKILSSCSSVLLLCFCAPTSALWPNAGVTDWHPIPFQVCTECTDDDDMMIWWYDSLWKINWHF